MPTLNFIRRKQPFAPANCCFHVYIDGEKQTTLSNGEQETLNVDAGKHTLQINNNYFKGSVSSFAVADNDELSIDAYSQPILGVLYFLTPVALIVIATLRLFHISYPPIFGILGLVPLILFVLSALFYGTTKTAIVVKIR